MSEPAIDVVYLRGRGWHVRGLSMQDWRRISAVHLPENATDLDLLNAARSVFGHEPTRGARLHRLEPADRLPRAS